MSPARAWPRARGGAPSRLLRERAARRFRLRGACLIGLSVVAFWTLRLLGIL